MFTTLILIVHLLVCVVLVLMILLQSGKGADIGAVFGGGGSNTVFGSTGAATFLSKVTIGAAVTFMCTSIILTYFSGKSVSVERSRMTEQQGQEVPAAPSQAPAETSPATPGPAAPTTAPAEASKAQPSGDAAKAPVSAPAAQAAPAGQAPQADQSAPAERYSEPAAQAPPDGGAPAVGGDQAPPK